MLAFNYYLGSVIQSKNKNRMQEEGGEDKIVSSIFMGETGFPLTAWQTRQFTSMRLSLEFCKLIN
jgi:hypothetical protein